MTTLVVGASGATGKLVVGQLLDAGENAKVIIRESSNIPAEWNSRKQLTIIKGNIAEMNTDTLSDYIQDCDAIISCLGHTISWKGIYGKPRKLVTTSVAKLCEAIRQNAPTKPVKLILMNTSGNRNRDLNEPLSVGERIVITLLRLLLPPHPDNEKAADYLRINVGQNNAYIQWVAVRPDTLIDEAQVTEYSLHPSPIRSAIFNPGKTSRINVANLLKRLTTDEVLWQHWKGQMPVIYNCAAEKK
ncbi:MAG TPA: NAD(P)H-binding protein [Chryseosolibacter sp.]